MRQPCSFRSQATFDAGPCHRNWHRRFQEYRSVSTHSKRVLVVKSPAIKSANYQVKYIFRIDFKDLRGEDGKRRGSRSSYPSAVAVPCLASMSATTVLDYTEVRSELRLEPTALAEALLLELACHVTQTLRGLAS
jgi:hypothetical protein